MPKTFQKDYINRVGKYNYDANTHSLPKKRINIFINWDYLNYNIGLNVPHIDGYKNSRPISGLGLEYGYKTHSRQSQNHLQTYAK